MSRIHRAFGFAIGISLFLTITSPGVIGAQVIMKPAPPGPSKTVATAAIKDAGHACGTVLDAVRLSDGTIRAVCSSGDAYRIFAVETEAGKTVVLAMNCSAAAKLGIAGC